MDEKTKERVHAIAKSLKDLHLAANMEEAMDRAKEIVKSAGDDKPIKDLVKHIRDEAERQEHAAVHVAEAVEKAGKELSAEASAHRTGIQKNLEAGKESKADAKKTKEDIAHDIKVHKLEKGDVKEATHEVDDISCAAGDAEYIADEADKVQKEKKK